METTFSSEVIDALGTPGAVAKPVMVAGEIVDIELVWLSEALRSVPGIQNYIGARLSDVYPDLYDEGWLEELVVAKTTGKRSVRFRQSIRPASGQLDLFEISARWADDLLVMSLNDLTVYAASDAEVVRSASFGIEFFADSPMLVNLHLPTQTMKFTTRALRERLGGGEVTRDNLVVAEDRSKLDDWLATPIDRRPEPLTFRSRSVDGEVRWCQISGAKIHGTGLRFDIVRDVDNFVRSVRASEELAEDLQGQLDLVSRALDASSDGFAIWRGVRDASGEIVNFTLDFMNTAGAAPTGRPASELLNGTIKDVIGRDQSAGLIELFKRVLASGETAIDVVTVESENGWTGEFENHVAPIGHDRVVASFRDISVPTR